MRPLLILGGRLPGAVNCLCLHQTGITTGFHWMEAIPSHHSEQPFLDTSLFSLITALSTYDVAGTFLRVLHECSHLVLANTL